jgi:hypothetical protein
VSSSVVDAALARVRAALEWRFVRPWAATVAFWHLTRLRTAMTAAERGTCPSWIVVELAHVFVDHVRAVGMPLGVVRRMRAGRRAES